MVITNVGMAMFTFSQEQITELSNLHSTSEVEKGFFNHFVIGLTGKHGFLTLALKDVQDQLPHGEDIVVWDMRVQWSWDATLLDGEGDWTNSDVLDLVDEELTRCLDEFDEGRGDTGIKLSKIDITWKPDAAQLLSGVLVEQLRQTDSKIISTWRALLAADYFWDQGSAAASKEHTIAFEGERRTWVVDSDSDDDTDVDDDSS